MSLLEQINSRRKVLKQTETVVTRPDGRRFIETKINDTNQEISNAPYGFVVDEKPDDIPAQVVPHLFVGSQDCCDRWVLAKYDISCVLSVGVRPPCEFPDVRYKFVPCLDVPETDIEVSLRNVCVPFINDCLENNCNVLVHCNAGVSRSPAVLIGYLVVVLNYRYEDAFNAVKNVRNCIKPNLGFVKVLKALK